VNYAAQFGDVASRKGPGDSVGISADEEAAILESLKLPTASSDVSPRADRRLPGICGSRARRHALCLQRPQRSLANAKQGILRLRDADDDDRCGKPKTTMADVDSPRTRRRRPYRPYHRRTSRYTDTDGDGVSDEERILVNVG
jgi:hypothetical protein